MKRVVWWVTVIAALGAACDSSRRATPASTGATREPTSGTAPSAQPGSTAPSAQPAGSSVATAAGGASTASTSASTLPHPLFWSVEKAGHTTYFLGTMHMGIDAEARLPPLVWTKLAAARTFAMEADLDDPKAAALLQPTTRSLRTDLGDAHWNKLVDALGAGTAKSLEHMPPMIPAILLSMRGLPPTTAMDRVLAARAAREQKPIVFLESAAHQLALLRKWMDLKALRVMLDQLSTSEQHTRAMLDAYVEGDERKIVEISDREKDQALQHGYTAAEYDQEMTELLYDRNASWIDHIERLHAAGGGFVAVGTMHLVGPRSVLALLADKGYTVTRVVR
jgi:uncharacterized protein